MSVIQKLIDILRFQAKPEDTPYNPKYTLIAFISAWGTGTLQASLNPVIESPSLFVLVQLLTLTNLVCLFLIAGGKKVRIPQTLLALFGCSTFMQILFYIASNFGLGIVLIITAIWSFILQVYILRHAMEISRAQSFFLTIGLQLTVSFITAMFFPEFIENMLEVLKESSLQQQQER